MTVYRTSDDFKSHYSLQERRKQSEQIRTRYPDRVPIICDAFISPRIRSEHRPPPIDKIKYLVPIELTMGEFLYIIRKRLHLASEHALFILVHNAVMKSERTVMDVYNEHKSEDGFLYVKYTREATFG